MASSCRTRIWEVMVASFIGVDTHKDTLSASVVDELGREVESSDAINDGRGFRKIERLARRVGAGRGASSARAHLVWDWRSTCSARASMLERSPGSSSDGIGEARPKARATGWTRF